MFWGDRLGKGAEARHPYVSDKDACGRVPAILDSDQSSPKKRPNRRCYFLTGSRKDQNQENNIRESKS